MCGQSVSLRYHTEPFLWEVHFKWDCLKECLWDICGHAIFFRIVNKEALDSEQIWYKNKATNWGSGLAWVFLPCNIFWNSVTTFQAKNIPINKFSFASAIMNSSSIIHILSVNWVIFSPYIQMILRFLHIFCKKKKKGKRKVIYIIWVQPKPWNNFRLLSICWTIWTHIFQSILMRNVLNFL